MNTVSTDTDFATLTATIKTWAQELGFQAVGISDTDLHTEALGLQQYLQEGRHGSMDYMLRHGMLRAEPVQLVPGTLRIISVRLDYTPPAATDSWQVMRNSDKAFLSRYALGRDYHKVLRAKLQKLATRIETVVNDVQYRVFTDSAPVMEVALARKAGIGWRGKHTLLLSREAGSHFFLGELFTNLPLVADTVTSDHCGSCTKCIDICPTQAITAPYKLDARRCISYLTIEHKGAIPIEFRQAIGNRIYGCDDCQLVCPWNKYAKLSLEPDFAIRHGLDNIDLLTLFSWTAAQFETRFAGSAIKRIGHTQFLRNIAVGLGNALSDSALPAAKRVAILHALQLRADDENEILREHVGWAIAQEPAITHATVIK
jgi:epoxyqueuosine reductase